jgi:hypothetical protein
MRYEFILAALLSRSWTEKYLIFTYAQIVDDTRGLASLHVALEAALICAT